VDFLEVLIKLFARCYYGWGATSEFRLKIGDFGPTRSVWPKISGRRGRPHQPFFLSQNYGIYRKWSFMWYKNMGTTFFRFVTNHVFDRQTDRQTAFSSLDRVCIPCSAVKIIDLFMMAARWSDVCFHFFSWVQGFRPVRQCIQQSVVDNIFTQQTFFLTNVAFCRSWKSFGTF